MGTLQQLSVLVNTADSYLSMGTLQQLSVLVNTTDNCLPLGMLLIAASANTADVYLSL